MRIRRSIGGRRTGLLWLGVLAGLAVAGTLTYVLLVILPESQSVRMAEEQRAQATATAAARAAEIERAYAAGIAFVVASDWEEAAEQFSLIVALDPGYRDAVAQLSEARNRANTTRTSATATAQASDLQRFYDTGMVFAATEDWEKAAEHFARIVAIEPGYKDVANRLAEARNKGRAQAEAANQATATVQAKATETAKKEEQARATVEAQRTARARADQATATVQAKAAEAKPTISTKPPSAPTTAPSSVSPVQFIKDYYAGINARRYPQTWAMLSDYFKQRMHCCNADGSYQYDEEYVVW